MKAWTERLPGILAFIESGNGIAKAKAIKELEKMAVLADKIKNNIIPRFCSVCEKEVKNTHFGFALCEDHKNS